MFERQLRGARLFGYEVELFAAGCAVRFVFVDVLDVLAAQRFFLFFVPVRDVAHLVLGPVGFAQARPGFRGFFFFFIGFFAAFRFVIDADRVQ